MRLSLVFQPGDILTANGLGTLNQRELDFGTRDRRSFAWPGFHQSQRITNEPFQPRSRRGIQLLQGLIDFQGQSAHALNLMHSRVLCIHKIDARHRLWINSSLWVDACAIHRLDDFGGIADTRAMNTLETDVEVSADGSLKLLSPLPEWLKPGRVHVVLSVPNGTSPKAKRVIPTATPEMLAKRAAAFEAIRALGGLRDVIPDPVALSQEIRENVASQAHA
jgi:hypothetical protein